MSLICEVTGRVIDRFCGKVGHKRDWKWLFYCHESEKKNLELLVCTILEAACCQVRVTTVVSHSLLDYSKSGIFRTLQSTFVTRGSKHTTILGTWSAMSFPLSQQLNSH